MNVEEAEASTDPERRPVSTWTLLSEGIARLRDHPSVPIAFLLAGLLVAAVDALRRGDAVPTVGFLGVQSGEFSVRFGVLARVYARTTTPPAALYALQPSWLARVAALELLRGAVVVAAGVYGFGRLLDVRPGLAATARYAGVFALVSLAALQVDAGPILGIPLLVVFFVILVRVAAFPAFLVQGDGVGQALRRSWRRTRGHGWAVFGVVLVVGLANHALTSVPVVGPVGSSLAVALQAGVVVSFVRRTAPRAR